MRRTPDDFNALKIAGGFVKDWSIAIDGGANIGDWSEELARSFDLVHAFEPGRDMVQIMRDRFLGRDDIRIHHQALWSETTVVSLRDHPDGPGKTRWRYVVPGHGDIEAVAIDDLNLPSCGLIKLDLEGAEEAALQGARNTLYKYHPVVIVECKQRTLERLGISVSDIIFELVSLGAKERGGHRYDRVFAWD